MTATVRTLIECLQKDDKDLKQLELALKKESEALQSRQVKLLEDATKVKAKALTSLEQRAKEKTQILIALGFSPETQTVDQFLNSLGNGPLKKIWQYIRNKLKRCQQLNAINGKVVSHSQARVNKMMEIIRGKTNQESLYTPYGKEKSASNSYKIASA